MNRGQIGAALLVLACGVSLGQNAPRPSVPQQPTRILRDQREMSGRWSPGKNAAMLRRRALQQKLRMRAVRNSVLGSGGNSGWISLGPSPLPSDASGTGVQDYGYVSGRATAVVIDPNDITGNTVFVGGAYGGVWKSTNAGNLSSDPNSVTWTPLTDSQETLAVGAIAIQPQAANPDPSKSVVLVGTGEMSSALDSYYGMGILRSTDGGQTWISIPQDATGTHWFVGLGFSRIVFSTTNPNLVVAATGAASQGVISGLEVPVGVDRGLYYSNDAGLNWHLAKISDAGVGVSGASVTSVQFNAAAGLFYAAVQSHGFYTSADGANWTRLATQPGTGLAAYLCPPSSSQSSCAITRGEIAVVPGRAGPKGLGEMYVWYIDANEVDQGIWTTSDGGNSWTRINDSGIANCGDSAGCGTSGSTRGLALAAVPNGSVTDVYAGATNLYKCMVTAINPTCNGTGLNTFVNLTHVYGCSDIANMHPGQHAIDFMVSNGTSLLYYANDGGVYRTPDGYLGLRSGTCGHHNRFESLNATIGPLTQFVSLAGSASNPNLMFGGTQANGAPATGSAQSRGPWLDVEAGDVGVTAMNPADENDWFMTASPNGPPGVGVFHCPYGINCHTQNFQNNPVVDSSAVGNDAALYLPFVFDPANAGALMVGTCRIWVGSSSGGSYSLLSPNFETGDTSPCTGAETNVIRTLAAGGPVGRLGHSQVIYAGTDGKGPSLSVSPIGGRVWITTNSDNGPADWGDYTGNINPEGYPISSIVVDPADPTGQTAYVAVMGFQNSHVWQTTDAGLSWTDFTANLPDAPANTLAIDLSDPTGETLYVGTDVGVFATSTTYPNWVEVEPDSGQPRFLPNVAVTALQIFNAGGVRKLRAATYGRGIWEFDLGTTPDFQIAMSSSSAVVFVGQNAIFDGVLYSQAGYSDNVSLTCVSAGTPPPQSCSASPAVLTPSAGGSAFTISAGAAAGDYAFNLQAIGADPGATMHVVPLSLQVVNFDLGTPTPAMVGVAAGAKSAPISVVVSAAGPFSGAVTLACSGLPQGASCNFQPASVSPTASAPAPVNLILSTSPTTPVGNYSIPIDATTSGGPTRTQGLSLVVTATPDFTLNVGNPNLTAEVNTTVSFAGTITGVNGYNSAIALSCGLGAPPSCTPKPASIQPASATNFTVEVSSGVSQSYNFNVNAVGSDSASITHSFAVTFTSTPHENFDFVMGATPASNSVAAGRTALFTLALDPGSVAFPTDVSVACSGLPALTSCAFSPTRVSAGSSSSVVALTMATTAPTANSAPASNLPMLAVLVFPLGLFRGKMRRKLAIIMLAAVVFTSCGGLQGNGTGDRGGGSPGTPSGTYTITISATCGTIVHSAPVTLTVTP